MNSKRLDKIAKATKMPEKLKTEKAFVKNWAQENIKSLDSKFDRGYLRYEQLQSLIESARQEIWKLEIDIESYIANANAVMGSVYNLRYSKFSQEYIEPTLKKFDEKGFDDGDVQCFIRAVADEFLYTKDDFFSQFFCTGIKEASYVGYSQAYDRAEKYVNVFFSDGQIEFYISIPILAVGTEPDAFYGIYSDYEPKQVGKYSIIGPDGENYNFWNGKNDSTVKVKSRPTGSQFFFKAFFNTNRYCTDTIYVGHNHLKLTKALVEHISKKRAEGTVNVPDTIL